jgi:hypothetical protein
MGYLNLYGLHGVGWYYYYRAIHEQNRRRALWIAKGPPYSGKA